MKRALLLIALCCILAGTAGAQQIKTSPFEGAWVWDGKGEEHPEFDEMIFFGNVMLIIFNEGYIGVVFSFTDQVIICGEGRETVRMPYRLSPGSIILELDGEDFTYIKFRSMTSPLEGIWRATEYKEDEELEEIEYILFTRDIMAFNAKGGYIGFRIDFKGDALYPEHEELQMFAFKFKVSGRNLTLNRHDDDAMIKLVKVY